MTHKAANLKFNVKRASIGAKSPSKPHINFERAATIVSQGTMKSIAHSHHMSQMTISKMSKSKIYESPNNDGQKDTKAKTSFNFHKVNRSFAYKNTSLSPNYHLVISKHSKNNSLLIVPNSAVAPA